MGDIENIRPDDVGYVRENLGQAPGVVCLIDVLDVLTPLFRRHGVADVIDVEAQRFCQIVESMEFQLLVDGLDHETTSGFSDARGIGDRPRFSSGGRKPWSVPDSPGGLTAPGGAHYNSLNSTCMQARGPRPARTRG